mgnify:CR=1 FL=1
MIFDSIDNIKTYFNFKEFTTVLNSVASISLNSLDSKIDLGQGNYIKVMSDETRNQSEIIESHKREVDIQILLKGNELIKVYDSKEVDVKTPYNPDNDCQFYTNARTPHTHVILSEGYFAVFFPQDIHNPLNVVGSPEELKKIVIKLNLNWLQEKMRYDS